MRIPVLAALVAAALLATCGPTGDPDLDVGPVRASAPTGGFSQIVLEVTNTGDGDDRLVGADTDAALGVEIHVTEIEDDRATMAELDDVELPAGQTVRFRPGGLHLMMVLPEDHVEVGGTFELTLRFERTGEMTVPVEVVELLDLAENSDG